MTDVLAEATRALRAEGDRPAQEARFTRGRVLATTRGRRRRRRTAIRVLIPIAAVLVGGTTWAAASGNLPPLLLEAVGITGDAPDEPPEGGVEEAQGKEKTGRVMDAIDTQQLSREEAAEPAEIDPAAEDVAVADEAKGREPPPEAASPTVVAPPSPPPLDAKDPSSTVGSTKVPVADPTLALYREAHRAHFTDRNWASALARWDAYLQAAPRGRFAVEARYNRALCLLRLGRRAEARAALEPFASGSYGEYRKREASDLIEALGPR